MLNVAIIVGSTRPGRKAGAIARRVHGIAVKRTDASFEVVDVASFGVPLLDEPIPPVMSQCSMPQRKAWAPNKESDVAAMLNELVPWGEALQRLRQSRAKA